MKFVTWVVTQTNRRDQVGYIATALYHDKCLVDRSYTGALKHAQERHAATAEDVSYFEMANEEYNSWMASRHGRAER